MAQFLVIGELRPDLLDNGPPEDLEALLQEEQVRGLEYAETGVVSQVWSIANVTGAVAIFEAEDRAAFDTIYGDLPLVKAGYVSARIIELAAYQGIPGA